MPYAMLAVFGLLGSGLSYLKGRYDSITGVLKAPTTSPLQSVFGSPFMLGLTIVLGLVGLAYFKQIKAVLKGAFK